MLMHCKCQHGVRLMLLAKLRPSTCFIACTNKEHLKIAACLDKGERCPACASLPALACPLLTHLPFTHLLTCPLLNQLPLTFLVNYLFAVTGAMQPCTSRTWTSPPSLRCLCQRGRRCGTCKCCRMQLSHAYPCQQRRNGACMSRPLCQQGRRCGTCTWLRNQVMQFLVSK